MSETAVQLIRHATLRVTLDGVTFLVDPMLDEQGARPPIPNTPNDRRNPLAPLPDVTLDPDAIAVTHTHVDHFDEAAAARLSHDLPVFCQPPDRDEIRDAGFTDVRPVRRSTSFDDVSISRTDGRHGHDELADDMGPVSGFVFDGAPTSIFVAGDTVWCDELNDALEVHSPDVVVLNAGGAQFVTGEPITMTIEDIRQVRQAVPDATLIAVHMDAINHCLLSRDDLRGTVPGLLIPADGERIDL